MPDELHNDQVMWYVLTKFKIVSKSYFKKNKLGISLHLIRQKFRRNAALSQLMYQYVEAFEFGHTCQLKPALTVEQICRL